MDPEQGLRCVACQICEKECPPRCITIEKSKDKKADFVGKQHKKDASKASITADVSIGPRDGGGFGLAVKLRVEDSSLPQSDLAALAKEAHEKICPYSHATRGNVDVKIEVKGA